MNFNFLKMFNIEDAKPLINKFGSKIKVYTVGAKNGDEVYVIFESSLNTKMIQAMENNKLSGILYVHDFNVENDNNMMQKFCVTDGLLKGYTTFEKIKTLDDVENYLNS